MNCSPTNILAGPLSVDVRALKLQYRNPKDTFEVLCEGAENKVYFLAVKCGTQYVSWSRVFALI